MRLLSNGYGVRVRCEPSNLGASVRSRALIPSSALWYAMHSIIGIMRYTMISEDELSAIAIVIHTS